MCFQLGTHVVTSQMLQTVLVSLAQPAGGLAITATWVKLPSYESLNFGPD